MKGKRFSVPLRLMLGFAFAASFAAGCSDENDTDLSSLRPPQSKGDGFFGRDDTAARDDVGVPGDFDGDNVADEVDNCPVLANPDQDDVDGDLIGDACDDCPTVADPEQTDDNENNQGDACEGDAGVPSGGDAGVPAGGDAGVPGTMTPGGDDINVPTMPLRFPTRHDDV